jgi:protein-S-isoprenylcysteine O-methyltransferase Ste14
MIHIILIFLAFALIHSITVAQWFKRASAAVLGKTVMRVWYRFLYTAVSAVTAAIALWLMHREPDRHLWTAPPLLRWTMHGVQFAGAAFGAAAFRHLDGLEFLGLRQVWRYLVRREALGNIEGLTQRDLVTTGVYGMVRHPLYVAGIIVVSFSPIITVNGLTVTVLADLYFLFGMFIEERRFLTIFGGSYRDYLQKVPRIFPRLLRRYRG